MTLPATVARCEGIRGPQGPIHPCIDCARRTTPASSLTQEWMNSMVVINTGRGPSCDSYLPPDTEFAAAAEAEQQET